MGVEYTSLQQQGTARRRQSCPAPTLLSPTHGAEVVGGRADGGHVVCCERNAGHNVGSVRAQAANWAGGHLGGCALDLRARIPVGCAALGLGAHGQHKLGKRTALAGRVDPDLSRVLGFRPRNDCHRPAAEHGRVVGQARPAGFSRRHEQGASTPRLAAAAASATHGMAPGVVTWPFAACLDSSPDSDMAVDTKL